MRLWSWVHFAQTCFFCILFCMPFINIIFNTIKIICSRKHIDLSSFLPEVLKNFFREECWYKRTIFGSIYLAILTWPLKICTGIIFYIVVYFTLFRVQAESQLERKYGPVIWVAFFLLNERCRLTGGTRKGK